MLLFFQIQLTSSGQTALTPVAGFFVVYFLVIAIILIIGWHFIRRSARSRRRLPKKYRLHTFLVKVPRAGIDEESKENLQLVQEKIAVAESLYSVIGGLKPQVGFSSWIYGRRDHISFEMVAHRGLIHFYIAVPEYLKKLLEDQIHAQYPDAQIEEVGDYNIFKPKSFSFGTYLVLERPHALSLIHI